LLSLKLNTSNEVNTLIDENGNIIEPVVGDMSKITQEDNQYIVPSWRKDQNFIDPKFSFKNMEWVENAPDKDLEIQIKNTFDNRIRLYIKNNKGKISNINAYIVRQNKTYKYMENNYDKYSLAFSSLIQGESFPLKMYNETDGKEEKIEVSWDELRKFNLFLIDIDEKIEEYINSISKNIHDSFMEGTKEKNMKERLEILRMMDIDRIIERKIKDRMDDNIE